jgi:UDP-N-acetylglucosamine 2-epimerase
MIIDLILIIGIRGPLNRGKSLDGPMVMVLGIRPDIIRASIIIRELRSRLGNNFKLVWSGQHYSENLKDIFFKELNVGLSESSGS